MDSIEQIEAKIFQSNGINLFNLIKKLGKNYLESNRERVISIFYRYAKEGEFIHWRHSMISSIAEIVHENEEDFAYIFEWSILIPDLLYWSIDGLLKTKGKKAYPKLVEIIIDDNISLERRWKATKAISIYSKQTFDRNLSLDSREWDINDCIRTNEILDWQKNGYKDGSGYEQPKSHQSLLNPITEFEKLIAKLEKKLLKQRALRQDGANPSNWLVVANEKQLIEVKQIWNLPKIYLDFLENYSPLNVTINNREFYNTFSLYGVDNLIENQDGYSFTSTPKYEELEDWPNGFVVIADHGGDPFCINTNVVINGDSPIFTSYHGQGEWNFQLVSKSFTDFIKKIIAGKVFSE